MGCVLAGEGDRGGSDGGAGDEVAGGEQAVGEETEGVRDGLALALAVEDDGGEHALDEGEETVGLVDEDRAVELWDAESSEAEGGSAHELKGVMVGLDEVLDGVSAEDEGEREALVMGVVELGEDVEAAALREAAEYGDEGAIGGAEAEALTSRMEGHEAGVAGEPEGLGGEG